MNKIDSITYKEIRRISPSQFYSMKSCAYKSLLAEAYGKKPLLPVSPNAYFGTVLHKVLELISKGYVKNEDDFNTEFEKQVKVQEEYLKENGYGYFTPLQKNVKDFGIKKVLLKKHLRTASGKIVSPPASNLYSEKWFQSSDGLVGGKIDMVIEDGDYIEIMDFKTGTVTQDVLDDVGDVFSEVKEEYKEQLKLYAYLYFENTGKFPSKLTLIDLARQHFEITFSPAGCEQLFKDAKDLLLKTNRSVTTRQFEATPAPDNCKYCLYRPACTFFIGHLGTSKSFNDVTGLLRQAVKYRNGNVSLFLESGADQLVLTGFSQENYEEFLLAQGKRIGVFNLRKEGSEFAYSSTKTTMVYEY